jgi:hypothetical protein
MLSNFIIVISIVTYFLGYPHVTFWFLVFALIQGIGAALRVALNPDWYLSKRSEYMMQKHGQIEVFGQVPKSFFLTKIVASLIILYFLFKIGREIGYFN